MQPCREWEGVQKGANRNARSGLGAHAELAGLAMSLRRQLLNKAMAGVGFERETVRATELVAAQGDRKYVRVVADDRKLGRLLR
jgi:hypothetical protein